jgi:hypothetical protein
MIEQGQSSTNSRGRPDNGTSLPLKQALELHANEHLVLDHEHMTSAKGLVGESLHNRSFLC